MLMASSLASGIIPPLLPHPEDLEKIANSKSAAATAASAATESTAALDSASVSFPWRSLLGSTTLAAKRGLAAPAAAEYYYLEISHELLLLPLAVSTDPAIRAELAKANAAAAPVAAAAAGPCAADGEGRSALEQQQPLQQQDEASLRPAVCFPLPIHTAAAPSDVWGRLLDIEKHMKDRQTAAAVQESSNGTNRNSSTAALLLCIPQQEGENTDHAGSSRRSSNCELASPAAASASGESSISIPPQVEEQQQQQQLQRQQCTPDGYAAKNAAHVVIEPSDAGGRPKQQQLWLPALVLLPWPQSTGLADAPVSRNAEESSSTDATTPAALENNNSSRVEWEGMSFLGRRQGSAAPLKHPAASGLHCLLQWKLQQQELLRLTQAVLEHANVKPEHIKQQQNLLHSAPAAAGCWSSQKLVSPSKFLCANSEARTPISTGIAAAAVCEAEAAAGETGQAAETMQQDVQQWKISEQLFLSWLLQLTQRRQQTQEQRQRSLPQQQQQSQQPEEQPSQQRQQQNQQTEELASGHMLVTDDQLMPSAAALSNSSLEQQPQLPQQALFLHPEIKTKRFLQWWRPGLTDIISTAELKQRRDSQRFIGAQQPQQPRESVTGEDSGAVHPKSSNTEMRQGDETATKTAEDVKLEAAVVFLVEDRSTNGSWIGQQRLPARQPTAWLSSRPLALSRAYPHASESPVAVFKWALSIRWTLRSCTAAFLSAAFPSLSSLTSTSQQPQQLTSAVLTAAADEATKAVCCSSSNDKSSASPSSVFISSPSPSLESSSVAANGAASAAVINLSLSQHKQMMQVLLQQQQAIDDGPLNASAVAAKPAEESKLVMLHGSSSTAGAGLKENKTLGDCSSNTRLHASPTAAAVVIEKETNVTLSNAAAAEQQHASSSNEEMVFSAAATNANKEQTKRKSFDAGVEYDAAPAALLSSTDPDKTGNCCSNSYSSGKGSSNSGYDKVKFTSLEEGGIDDNCSKESPLSHIRVEMNHSNNTNQQEKGLTSGPDDDAPICGNEKAHSFVLQSDRHNNSCSSECNSGSSDSGNVKSSSNSPTTTNTFLKLLAKHDTTRSATPPSRDSNSIGNNLTITNNSDGNNNISRNNGTSSSNILMSSNSSSNSPGTNTSTGNFRITSNSSNNTKILNSSDHNSISSNLLIITGKNHSSSNILTHTNNKRTNTTSDDSNSSAVSGCSSSDNSSDSSSSISNLMSRRGSESTTCGSRIALQLQRLTTEKRKAEDELQQLLVEYEELAEAKLQQQIIHAEAVKQAEEKNVQLTAQLARVQEEKASHIAALETSMQEQQERETALRAKLAQLEKEFAETLQQLQQKKEMEGQMKQNSENLMKQYQSVARENHRLSNSLAESAQLLKKYAAAYKLIEQQLQQLPLPTIAAAATTAPLTAASMKPTTDSSGEAVSVSVVEDRGAAFEHSGDCGVAAESAPFRAKNKSTFPAQAETAFGSAASLSSSGTEEETAVATPAASTSTEQKMLLMLGGAEFHPPSAQPAQTPGGTSAPKKEATEGPAAAEGGTKKAAAPAGGLAGPSNTEKVAGVLVASMIATEKRQIPFLAGAAQTAGMTAGTESAKKRRKTGDSQSEELLLDVEDFISQSKSSNSAERSPSTHSFDFSSSSQHQEDRNLQPPSTTTMSPAASFLLRSSPTSLLQQKHSEQSSSPILRQRHHQPPQGHYHPQSQEKDQQHLVQPHQHSLVRHQHHSAYPLELQHQHQGQPAQQLQEHAAQQLQKQAAQQLQEQAAQQLEEQTAQPLDEQAAQQLQEQVAQQLQEQAAQQLQEQAAQQLQEQAAQQLQEQAAQQLKDLAIQDQLARRKEEQQRGLAIATASVTAFSSENSLSCRSTGGAGEAGGLARFNGSQLPVRLQQQPPHEGFQKQQQQQQQKSLQHHLFSLGPQKQLPHGGCDLTAAVPLSIYSPEATHHAVLRHQHQQPFHQQQHYPQQQPLLQQQQLQQPPYHLHQQAMSTSCTTRKFLGRGRESGWTTSSQEKHQTLQQQQHAPTFSIKSSTTNKQRKHPQSGWSYGAGATPEDDFTFLE